MAVIALGFILQCLIFPDGLFVWARFAKRLIFITGLFVTKCYDDTVS